MEPGTVPIVAAKSHTEAVTDHIEDVTAYVHAFEPTATTNEKMEKILCCSKGRRPSDPHRLLKLFIRAEVGIFPSGTRPPVVLRKPVKGVSEVRLNIFLFFSIVYFFSIFFLFFVST